jgi:hypothetical protein
MDYVTQNIEGWTVHTRDTLLESQPAATKVALKLLREQLRFLVRKLPKNAVTFMKTVPIFLSPDYPGLPKGGEYHPSEQWLREHGRDPKMARCVELHNISIFPAEVRRMPVFVLHEMAHAYHDQVLGYDNADVQDEFNRAMASRAYDSVLRSDGKRVKAYAATNVQEFFAEVSEAFFGRNDFFPFQRSDLEHYDPDTAAMLKKVWRR